MSDKYEFAHSYHPIRPPVDGHLGARRDPEGVPRYDGHEPPGVRRPSELPSVTLHGIPVVSLVVYDVLGREIARLVEKELPAGWHRARFDAGNLSSGVYLYRIQAGDFQDTGRMILLK